MKKTIQGNGSIDIQFARQLAQDKAWAKRDGVLYHWNGDFWEAQEHRIMAEFAADWLDRNFPDDFSAKRADCLVNAAILKCRNLPSVDGRNIVPTKGCYLEVLSDGTIQAIAPSPELGMTYAVNANIGKTIGDYAPKKLDDKSLFSRFITRSLPSLEVRNVVQEYIGYSLLMTTEFQVGQFWIGNGRNGKSVCLDIVAALHAKPVAMRLDGLNGFALQSLVGASLAQVSEAPKSNIDVETLKALIAGDTITIDRKYLSPVSYKPTAKWLVAANNVMRSNDQSDGWWRRFQIIPWSVQIPESEVISNLSTQIIKNELHLVLDWALEGVSRLLARGRFDASATVLKNAKQEAMEESNPVVAWATEVEPVAHDIGMPKSDVYAEFCSWATANNYRPPASHEFWKRLKSHFKDSFQMDKRHQRQVNGKVVDYVRFAFGDALRNLEAPWDAESPSIGFILPKGKNPYPSAESRSS